MTQPKEKEDNPIEPGIFSSTKGDIFCVGNKRQCALLGMILFCCCKRLHSSGSHYASKLADAQVMKLFRAE